MSLSMSLLLFLLLLTVPIIVVSDSASSCASTSTSTSNVYASTEPSNNMQSNCPGCPTSLSQSELNDPQLLHYTEEAVMKGLNELKPTSKSKVHVSLRQGAESRGIEIVEGTKQVVAGLRYRLKVKMEVEVCSSSSSSSASSSAAAAAARNKKRGGSHDKCTRDGGAHRYVHTYDLDFVVRPWEEKNKGNSSNNGFIELIRMDRDRDGAGDGDGDGPSYLTKNQHYEKQSPSGMLENSLREEKSQDPLVQARSAVVDMLYVMLVVGGVIYFARRVLKHP